MQLNLVTINLKFKFYLELVKSTSRKNPPCHADTIIHTSGNIRVVLSMKFLVEPRKYIICAVPVVWRSNNIVICRWEYALCEAINLWICILQWQENIPKLNFRCRNLNMYTVQNWNQEALISNTNIVLKTSHSEKRDKLDLHDQIKFTPTWEHAHGGARECSFRDQIQCHPQESATSQNFVTSHIVPPAMNNHSPSPLHRLHVWNLN